MIIRIVIIVISMYVLFTQISAYFSYKFCKRDRLSKECRNLTCKYAKECKRNSLYHE